MRSTSLGQLQIPKLRNDNRCLYVHTIATLTTHYCHCINLTHVLHASSHNDLGVP